MLNILNFKDEQGGGELCPIHTGFKRPLHFISRWLFDENIYKMMCRYQCNLKIHYITFCKITVQGIIEDSKLTLFAPSMTFIYFIPTSKTSGSKRFQWVS